MYMGVCVCVSVSMSNQNICNVRVNHVVQLNRCHLVVI